MNDGWMTTGEVATLLGVSRQHVVDMCDRGHLACVRVGSHRRIRRTELQRVLEPQLTRQEAKSLWLHRALLGRLMLDPPGVVEAARANIARWKPQHRSDGVSMHYLEQWERVLSEGVDSVAAVLTGVNRSCIELRQNSPFAGVLSDSERRRILRAFSEDWVRLHPAS